MHPPTCTIPLIRLTARRDLETRSDVMTPRLKRIQPARQVHAGNKLNACARACAYSQLEHRSHEVRCMRRETRWTRQSKARPPRPRLAWSGLARRTCPQRTRPRRLLSEDRPDKRVIVDLAIPGSVSAQRSIRRHASRFTCMRHGRGRVAPSIKKAGHQDPRNTLATRHLIRRVLPFCTASARSNLPFRSRS